jgi:tryptophanyl-tRNA synthetase
MSLDDPEAKMSKSQKNTITLMDDAATIRKKVSRAVTDSQGTISYDKKRPGISNLIDIYHHASGMAIADIVEKYEGQGYKEFKSDLGDCLVEMLEPLQEKVREYMEGTELDRILADGAVRASKLAEAKLIEVKEKMGLL